MPPRRNSYSVRAEPSQAGDRTIRFVASTKDVARDGGIVEAWELENYRTNPVVLWAHNADSPPIGRATKVEDTDSALLIDVEFAGEEQSHPLAETTYRLLKSGFINSVSVGFNVTKERKPTEDERQRGASWVAESAELLELSVVPIPADVGAVAISRSANLTAADAKTIRHHLGAIEGWTSVADEIERLTMQKRELTESDVAFTVALRPVEDFVEDSFDNFEYQADPSVLAVFGELLEGGSIVVQGLAFPKDVWSLEEAEAWLAENEQAVLDWLKEDEPEDAPAEEQAEAPEEPEDEEEEPDEEQAEDIAEEDEEDDPPTSKDEGEDEEELPRSLIGGLSDEARDAIKQLVTEALTEVLQQPRSANRVDSAERKTPAAESVDADKYESLLDLTNRYLGKKPSK